MQALLTQLDFELQRFQATKQSIETVFIGGGTPSTVSPQLYAPLFEKLAPYLAKDAEITSEANPNSATYSWLQGMQALGVNRISFGVQSFNDAKLKALNRAHKSSDAINAIHHAHEIGFKNLSLDLIYAVQGDTKSLLQHDLDTAFSVPINHLSAYALTIEEHTAFATHPQMADEKLHLTRWLFKQIHAHGFTQYEISNFGTYQSRHNKGYWEYKDYIGLGSGAVGFLTDKRFYPSLHVEDYIDNPLHHETEILDEYARMQEMILLGLRSNVGLDPHTLTPSMQERIQMLVTENKLSQNGSRCYNLDFLLSDEIALFITA
jgi:oxygen-independent coproporphyrinogen III oxidase